MAESKPDGLSEEAGPYMSMFVHFDRAAKLIELESDLYTFMSYPSREITVYIPVRMDDGSVRVFVGHRSPARRVVGELNNLAFGHFGQNGQRPVHHKMVGDDG